jgi:CRP-like cAMP-binding protein
MGYERWSPEILRSLPLLRSLTEAEFTRLLPSIKRRHFEPRATILRTGQAPDGIYIIVTGSVHLTHEDQEGHSFVAENFGPGDLFGEMGFIDASACPANVIAAEVCEVAVLPRHAILERLESNATAAMSLVRVSLDRLCRAHRQLGSLALTTVYTRVAQLLLTRVHDDGGVWRVDVGSQQIAALVGASREMVSRVLHCLIEKRLVRRCKRRLIVIDPDALRAAATPTPRRST